MWLCGFYYGAFRVESCLALCHRVLSVLFSIVITTGKRELVHVLFVHVFVYFARVNFCTFSLPLGVRECLRVVIVAHPCIFYY